MRGRTISSILTASAFIAAAGGCASAQLDLSEHETGDILTDIQGRVDRERAEAKKESGNYPMPDEGHAISAKRLSRMQREEGNLTKDEFDRINRKADRILSEKPEA